MASSTIHERAVRLARDQADYESREAQPNYAAEYEYILRVLRAVPEVRKALRYARRLFPVGPCVTIHTPQGKETCGACVIDAALALLPAESEGDDA